MFWLPLELFSLSKVKPPGLLLGRWLTNHILPHCSTLSPGRVRCLFWVPSTPAPFLRALSTAVVGTRLESLGLQLGSECSACNFFPLQARTEFLRKKARHQNSLPAVEAAEAGAPGSSGPVDLFRELLEEGKAVTRGNKEYEEEKRQERVSWSYPLPLYGWSWRWGCALPSGVTTRVFREMVGIKQARELRIVLEHSM